MRTREPRHTCRTQCRASAAPSLPLLLLVTLLCGCSAARVMPPERLAASCLIDGGAPVPALDIAIARAVDPAHAPVPRHDDERLVFAQLYETLVRVDCDGTLASGLAESWTASDAGRIWTFRLRSNARFWDGEPVTARTLVDAWATSAQPPAFAWMSAVAERDVRIALHTPAADAYAFAHPSLAVARHDRASAWPIGTGPYVPAPATSGGLILIARDTLDDAPESLQLRRVAGDDPRRSLDARVDLLVSADPRVVAYARALPEYTVSPLPWTRTYYLAAPGVDAGAAPVIPPEDTRAALARDAASTGTRAATPPFPWTAAACAAPADTDTTDVRGQARSVAYERGDAVARGIAERLTALAWPAARAPAWLRTALADAADAAGAPTTAALDEHSLAAAIGAREHLAYVLALPRTRGHPCTTVAVALNPVQHAAIDEGLRLTPLVDGHAHLIRRAGLGTLSVDAAGTLRFDGGRP